MRHPDTAGILEAVGKGFAEERAAAGEATALLQLEGRSMECRHAYLREVVFPFALPTKIYAAMLVVWHLRPLLQARFPLHKGKVRDFVRFLAWCAMDGRRQFPLFRSIPEWNEELGRRVELPELRGDQWNGGCSVAMFFYAVARSKFTFGPVLTNSAWRNRVNRSFWRGERNKRFLPTPQEWQKEFVRARFGSVADLALRLRIHGEEALDAASLVRSFGLTDLESEPGGDLNRGSLMAPTPPVLLSPALRKSPVVLPILATKILNPWIERFEGRPGEFHLSTVMRHVSIVPRRIKKIRHSFGVNLFGYSRGEIGIGEDVRMVSKALDAHGIPNCIVDVKVGDNVSQRDLSVLHKVAATPRYGINLFCVTGIEHGRFVCENGLEDLEGRFNIGLWPWELPHWPSSCYYAFGAVDEVWGISSHAARAYRSTSPHPVFAMSVPVELRAFEPEPRASFGLPESPYLFVFAFDVNSKVTRKNPDGLVRAFQAAFPREGPEEVGLVLKVGHAETACPLWARVRRAAEGDPRIHLIEETMRKPRVLALFNACDCFVSLHRAEGFGRCLAESLLLGKQVIATGFSGNLDFCHEPRVALVRHRMRQVRPREYFWSEGQMWAEPDLDHAAELMREIRSTPRDVGLGNSDFSPEAVGNLYKARLLSIWNELDGSM